MRINEIINEWLKDTDKVLDISLKGLKEIPKEILQYGSLIKKLDCSNNQLTHLSDDDFKKVQTIGSPMDLLANWDGDWKCVWCKHQVGANGDISKGCFYPIGARYLSREQYVRCLEGEREQILSYSILLNDRPKFNSLVLGNIIEDTGSEQIERISVQKSEFNVKVPKNIIFDRAKGVNPKEP